MNIYKFLLLLPLFLLAACGDDNNDTCKVPAADNLLHYDCPNNSGPLLEAGVHELAIRFPASQLADYAGKNLTQVEVFFGIKPAAASIKIYDGLASATPQPGAMLSNEINVTNAIKVQEWNTYTVSPPVPIGNTDIWISVKVNHATTQQSVGCDAGPRREGGDWLFSESDQEWKTYLARTGEGVNWNIRGVVE
ncbi:MAG: hypothetical protein H6577_04100 [Lewinellaceae bacterium]|nr:hypothetical protein [Saprospiraceae bacterium]MCB9337287.1 hypothetical protein [Lewinellaceae bacterium]